MIRESSLASFCKGALYNKDLGDKARVSYTGAELDEDAYANPCGFMPSSFPRGKQMRDNKDIFLSLRRKGSESDPIMIDYKSSNLTMRKIIEYEDEPQEQWLDVRTPLFLNWMVRHQHPIPQPLANSSRSPAHPPNSTNSGAGYTRISSQASTNSSLRTVSPI